MDTNCNLQGFQLGLHEHMNCLEPPLQEVSSDDFICDDCPSSSTIKATLPQKQSYDAAAQNNVDITQDEFTLQYLKTTVLEHSS